MRIQGKINEAEIVKKEWIRLIDRYNLRGKGEVKYLFTFSTWMILGENS